MVNADASTLIARLVALDGFQDEKQFSNHIAAMAGTGALFVPVDMDTALKARSQYKDRVARLSASLRQDGGALP